MNRIVHNLDDGTFSLKRETSAKATSLRSHWQQAASQIRTWIDSEKFETVGYLTNRWWNAP